MRTAADISRIERRKGFTSSYPYLSTGGVGEARAGAKRRDSSGATLLFRFTVSMNVTVKNVSKIPLVVPPSVRRQAGHKNGQDLEFRVSGGVITILPKPSAADDECTTEQRRIIDARLAEGLADIKAGRTFGPFDSAGEMIAHMKARLRKRVIAPKSKRSR
jgi:bifunctional DNA-binding transcriptional regulator/antitoxin component of YhaV-PrlF toxin-antitoxin module